MNKTTRSLSFPLFGAVFFFCMSTICFGQALDVKEHTEKFQKKWLEYLHALGNVEGSYLYTTVRNGTPEREFTNHLIASFPPLFVDLRGGTFDAPTYVEVYTEKYRFEVSRQSPADEWKPDMDCGSSFPDRNVRGINVPWRFPEHFSDPSCHFVNPAGYSIFNTIGVGLHGSSAYGNLPFMIGSEWTTIHELSLVEKDGEKRFFLSFDYKQNHLSVKGKAFLTTDFFLITEGEFYFEGGLGIEDVQVKIDYDNETYRVPLPKNYHRKTTYKFEALKEDMTARGLPYEGVHEIKTKFDLRETNPKSFERFTLPALGFPEPVFDEP